MAVIDDRTPVRDYPKPAPLNKLMDDVGRLRAALDAIATDIAAALSGLDGKAPLVHSHTIAAITGLLDALAGKAASNHQHALDDLSDVSVTGAANRALLMFSGGNWIPGNVLLADVVGWEATVNALISSAVASLAAAQGKRGRVRVATTANITIATALNAGDVIDGVTLAAGDLVLVKSQTTPAQNGIYVVGPTPARFSEFDAWDEFPGALIAVAEGTANVDSFWYCTSNYGGTLGTTALAFSKFNIAGELFAANNLSDLANVATAVANLGLANAILSSASAALTAGYTSAALLTGNSGSAGWTPNPTLRNFQHRYVTGAFAISPPAFDCSMILILEMAAGAGAVSFTGWSKALAGSDSFTTTLGNKFKVWLDVVNGISSYFVKAMQ